MKDFDVLGFLADDNNKKYRAFKNLGPHCTLVGSYIKGVDSWEYWLEIDGIKIPSTIGYCSSEKEFKERVAISARDFSKELFNELVVLL